ncbi:MAG: hypothetical protein LBC39_08245 [Methanobrevibacter sp.]|jgi:hypothetical protein|nr:hypothetical protein [Candidatus Methanovirga aequatorialis]
MSNENSTDILIKFIDEKFNNQNEKFDRIDVELKELKKDLTNIKENHLQHIYEDLEEIKIDIGVLKTFKNYLIPLLSTIIGIMGILVAILK